MPANALQIEERKFSTFEAVLDGESVKIEGQYEVTVVNSGLLRVPSVSASVSELSLPNGSTTIIEDTEIKSIGSLGRGQTGKAKFEFTVSGSSQELKQFAGTACRGSKSTLTTDETYSGLLLALASTGEVEIKSPSPSCRTEQPGPVRPDPPDRPEPPDDPDPPDPPTQPPREPEPPQEPEPEPQPPETQQVNIEGPTSPTVDEQATYSVSNPPNSASEYIWTSTGGVFDQSSPSDDNEYIVSYDDASLQTIRVDVRDNRGFQVGQGEIDIDVQEGGQDSRDRGGNGSDGNGGNGEPNFQNDSISGLDIVNVGEESTWTYDSQAEISSVTWDMGDGSPPANYPSTEITYTYEEPGEYNIQATAITPSGEENTESMTVEVDVTLSGGLTGPSIEPPSMSEAADNKEREY